MIPESERDSVDLLYAHLEQVEPPADLVARVMARARQSEAMRWPRWQRALFGFGYLAALIVLGVLSFLTGIELEHSHLRDLVALAVQDLASVTESPGVYLAALRDAIPWVHVLAVAGDIVLLAVATRFVLKVATPRGETRVRAAA